MRIDEISYNHKDGRQKRLLMDVKVYQIYYDI